MLVTRVFTSSKKLVAVCVLLTLLGLSSLSEAKMPRTGGGGTSRIMNQRLRPWESPLWRRLANTGFQFDDTPYQGGLYTNYAYSPYINQHAVNAYDRRNDDAPYVPDFGRQDLQEANEDDESKPCVGLCYIMKLRKLKEMNQR